MAEQNPYQAPKANATSPESIARSKKRFGFLLGVSVLALVATPMIGIPLAFFLTPAFVRAWRLSVIESEHEPRRHFGILVVSSFMYAFPSAVASAIAFFSVCMPVGYVGANVLFRPPSEEYGLMLLAGVTLLFVSTFLALWAGDAMLRRNNYFIREDEVQQDVESDGSD